jgi:transposase-like protein
MMSNMKQIEDPSAVGGPVGSEGGRSPSALSTGQAPTTLAMAPGASGTPATAAQKVGPLFLGQRWSVAPKREVVLRLLRGESVELLCRELGVPIFKLEQWRQKADAALDGALKEREAEAASTELAAAMQRIGELSMENDLLRAKMERPGPLARRRSR